MKTAKQLVPLIAAIVVLLAVFRFWVPQFLSLENLLDLAQQISINAVLAFGMTLVILIGGIDLSVGAVVALIGTLTVWLLPRIGLAGAITAGLAAATAFGAVNGACAARTAMPPFGIPLARNEITVYVACSLLAGLAGMIHASQLYSAEPGSGQGFELNAIAAVVVGGTSFTGGIGTMPGTFLGAIIIGILDKGLNQA